jgi:hypothetical protein
MWVIETTEGYDRRHKTYQKKHPQELQAVLDNLDTYFESLKLGVKPLQIKHGFMHQEPLGVVAIDQKGGGKSLAQTRLYVYPETEREVLYLITLGDKRSQKDDIKTCQAFVDQLRKETRTPDEQEKPVPQRPPDGPGPE